MWATHWNITNKYYWLWLCCTLWYEFWILYAMFTLYAEHTHHIRLFTVYCLRWLSWTWGLWAPRTIHVQFQKVLVFTFGRRIFIFFSFHELVNSFSLTSHRFVWIQNRAEHFMNKCWHIFVDSILLHFLFLSCFCCWWCCCAAPFSQLLTYQLFSVGAARSAHC